MGGFGLLADNVTLLFLLGVFFFLGWQSNQRATLASYDDSLKPLVEAGPEHRMFPRGWGE